MGESMNRPEQDLLWSDPLSSPDQRFPLGPPSEYWTECDDEPSGVAARPYSIRGVVALSTEQGPRVTHSYDTERQIGLIRDSNGQDVPLLKHTKPGATPAPTTGYRDGDPNNPPPEEMGSPDYQTD
jgi:hypothetical protein